MPLIQKRHKMNDFCVSTSFVASKRGVQNTMSQYGCQTYGGHGHYYAPTRKADGVAYVYHAEKVRPKIRYEKTFYKSGPKKGELKSTERIVVRQGGWKLRVFRFELNRVKLIDQNNRHFTVILK